MINRSLNELKLIAKSSDIKDYKEKSDQDLIKILSESKPKISLSKKIIKEIKKNFSESRERFSKSKIHEFRRSLYNIKKQKNLSAPEIKEAEKNLLELQKSLYNLKEYYNYDDNKYQGIEDTNLLGEVDECYYKSVKTKSAFNGNYIEYEIKGDKDKHLSTDEYLDIVKPYLRDMINDHKTRRKWKIQLTMRINFISLKDSKETCTMYTKSRNIEIMIGNETNDITEELCESLLQNYKKDLKEPMKRSEFFRDSTDLLYYHLQKIGLKRGGSYIVSTKWLKNKKATINPENNDDNCFQYTLTVALNHQNIGKNPQRISKIKPFIDQYY